MSDQAKPTGETLTVVVPTLNSAATLNWTLASLTAAKEIRVIVADSFSVDDTLEICKRWGVETISIPPGNMYTAINAGLRMARTEWLAYVNSDDWVFTDAYVGMLHTAMRSSADVAYGSADFVDQGGRFLFSVKSAPDRLAGRILRSGHMPFAQPAAIFRRTAFEALGGLDERYRAASDYEFFCRAAQSNHVLRRLETQPVAAFRLHGTQLSVQRPDLDRSEKIQMKDRLKAGSNLIDSYMFFRWRLSNIPAYAGRILRTYGLSGRLTLQRSHMPQNWDTGTRKMNDSHD